MKTGPGGQSTRYKRARGCGSPERGGGAACSPSRRSGRTPGSDAAEVYRIRTGIGEPGRMRYLMRPAHAHDVVTVAVTQCVRMRRLRWARAYRLEDCHPQHCARFALCQVRANSTRDHAQGGLTCRPCADYEARDALHAHTHLAYSHGEVHVAVVALCDLLVRLPFPHRNVPSELDLRRIVDRPSA